MPLSPALETPTSANEFELGFGLDDEQFVGALVGAVGDIVAQSNVPPEEGGLSNQEIFARLQGVHDAASERYSADEARRMQSWLSVAEAIGHAACGNEELLSGAQEHGLIDKETADQHTHHDAGAHNSYDRSKKKKHKQGKFASKTPAKNLGWFATAGHAKKSQHRRFFDLAA